MHNHWIDRLNPVFNQQGAGVWNKGYVEINRYLYDHEFVYFASGTTRVVTELTSGDCSAGYAIIIPPAMTHWSKALTGNVMRYCIHFDWESGNKKIIPPMSYVGRDTFDTSLAKMTPEWLPFKMPLFTFVGKDMAFFKDIQEFFALSKTDEKDKLKRKMLLGRIICTALLSTFKSAERSTKSGKSLRLVSKVKEYIEENYRNNISVESVARAMHVTPTHLCRVVHDSISMTPLEYITSLRIEEAKRLMIETALNISEIAYRSGFMDCNYFSRIFRKKTGLSPTAFISHNSSTTTIVPANT